MAIPQVASLDASTVEPVAQPVAMSARAGRPAPKSSAFARFFQNEDLNFLLTNRIPRRLATQFMGWFSRIRQPWVRSASIALWRAFAPDLDLGEAKQQEFASLHDCFIRELRPGARPIDPDHDVVASPCDGIVGACGRVRGTEAFQAKGMAYTLDELLGDPELVERHRDGLFVTLRLRSTMYHRFHAPCDLRIRRVDYFSGDTWNVNPIALKRVERLFCRNERAVVPLALSDERCAITLVPVAAILVAGIRMHCLPALPDLRYRGRNRLECDAAYRKGDELGWFEHGSTILVFASGDLSFDASVVEGATIRMGTPLLRGLAGRARSRIGSDMAVAPRDSDRSTADRSMEGDER